MGLIGGIRMKIKQRLKNLENTFKAIEENTGSGNTLTPEERRNRLIELAYKMGEYEGYKFISPEQYAALDDNSKKQYFEAGMMPRLRERADENKKQIGGLSMSPPG
jgi:hypothetical protein